VVNDNFLFFRSKNSDKQSPKKVGAKPRPGWLTEEQREHIIWLKYAKYDNQEIAEKVGCNPSTVWRWWKRFIQEQNVHTHKIPGRPSVITEREKRHLFRMMETGRKMSVEEMKEACSLNHVSSKTIYRLVSEHPLWYGGWEIKAPFLTEKARLARLAWCKERKDWTVEDWKCFLFSDESPFTLRFNRRTRCWRKTGELPNPKICKGTIKHDKKINVWGCFLWHGVGHLHIIEGNMNGEMYKNILIQHMLVSGQMLFGDEPYVFQQDNDPKHTCKVVKQYIEEKGINVSPWPSYSPDLNPIENLWSILDYQCRSRKSKNEAELFADLQNAWMNIPQETIQHLIESMPRRVAAVIKNKGNPTKY